MASPVIGKTIKAIYTEKKDGYCALELSFTDGTCATFTLESKFAMKAVMLAAEDESLPVKFKI